MYQELLNVPLAQPELIRLQAQVLAKNALRGIIQKSNQVFAQYALRATFLKMELINALFAQEEPILIKVLPLAYFVKGGITLTKVLNHVINVRLVLIPAQAPCRVKNALKVKVRKLARLSANK